jgi:hypothetical protein
MLRLAVFTCLLSAIASRPTADSRAQRSVNSHAAVDCVGYYGNSGLEVGEIPLIGDIDGNYNVIILTFAAISPNGTFSLDGQIQGPCVIPRSTRPAHTRTRTLASLRIANYTPQPYDFYCLLSRTCSSTSVGKCRRQVR